MMKLIPFKTSKETPSITIGINGEVYISLITATFLKLNDNSHFVLFQKEGFPKEWFLQVVKDDGFKPKRRKSFPGFSFRSKELREMMCKTLNFEKSKPLKLHISFVEDAEYACLYELKPI
jgi:hypothetical protein